MAFLPQRPSRVLVLGVATIAAALFTFLESRRLTERIESAPAAKSGSLATGEKRFSPSRDGGPKVASVAKSVLAPSAAANRPNPVLPSAVTQLLPSIQSPVSNWKEFKPEKITIAPYPDMPIEFTAVSIREEHGRTVWTGRNSAVEGAFLVAAATEGEWYATLVIPPVGAFEANIAGSMVTMLEKDFANNLCG